MSSRFQSTVFVLIAVALFAVTSLIAKSLGAQQSGNPLHPFQVSGGRFVFAFLAIFLVSRFIRVDFSALPVRQHALRSLCGFLGVTCLFAAAAILPLADANAISFLSVIVTMALSSYLLREHVGLHRWSAAAVALLGALFIARPGTSSFSPFALVALLGAVFIGVETIIIKMLSGHEKPIRILFINNLIGALISLAVLPFIWQQPTVEQWIALGAIGLIMLLAQFFNILAMQRGEASYVAPFWYAAPLFAALYDYLLFREVVSAWSALGVGLIILGGVVITRRERKAARQRTRSTTGVP